MQIGIVGLGRMGAGMARRLSQAGIGVICYDQANEARDALKGTPNIDCAENLAALCARLAGERIVVLMLPAGSAVEDTIRDLVPMLSAGDTVIDGGNSYYRDSMRRALELSQRGLRYIDAGVSGGIHGREQGYCLMLGGTPKSIEIFAPVAQLLAPHPENGWLHCGPSGAGDHGRAHEPLLEPGALGLHAAPARDDARALRRPSRPLRMIVVLMGVSGAGKTTIGKLVAARLGWRFIEGDDYHPKENVAKM